MATAALPMAMEVQIIASLVATPAEVQMQLILATPMKVQMIYLVEQTEGEPDEYRTTSDSGSSRAFTATAPHQAPQ